MQHRYFSYVLLLASLFFGPACEKFKEKVFGRMGQTEQSEPATEKTSKSPITEQKKPITEKNPWDRPPVSTDSSLDRSKINALLDKLVPRDGTDLTAEEITAMADLSPGISGDQTVEVNKETFIIYAGLENTITLNVNTPSAIIIYQGNGNIYTINKGPFKDDVLLITYNGEMNTYRGLTPLTVEGFRKE